MKSKTGKQDGVLNPIPPGKRPFEIIHADHVGPFITSNLGNVYVLCMIDTLTKFVIFEPVKNTTAKVTIKKMEDVINRFGAPRRIITDRGTAFTAGQFADLCEKHGIRHTLNSSRHPQANGLVERMNRTLIPAMAIRTGYGENRSWEREIKQIERDVNSTVSKTTG